MRIRLFTHLGTCVYARERVYVYALAGTCVYVRVCTCTCGVCMRTCVRTCVCLCARTLYVCINAKAILYLHIYVMNAFLFALVSGIKMFVNNLLLGGVFNTV